MILDPWLVALFALLAVWAFGPLAELLAHVIRHGGVITGANGSDPYDQLAYLAWIRDSGTHLLASNLWLIPPTPHDYLQPMFFISGLLWRLGASIQLAYLIWKPVALLVLFFGFAAYVRHQLPGSRGPQMAALALALFYLSPVLAFWSWAGSPPPLDSLNLVLASNDADSALNLWGFDHTAIAIGLMPVFLLGCERLLSGERSRKWTVGTALAGMFVSWLHPWQGLILLAVIGSMVGLKPPRRRYRALVWALAATLVPLLYGVILSRVDPSWHSFQAKTTTTGTAPWWALLATLGPLCAFAALGIRRAHDDREWMLLAWVAACAAVYFLIPEFPPHALSGITLPLALLAVRGWKRLRVGPRVSMLAGALAIVVFTVPASAYLAQQSRADIVDPTHAYVTQMLELTGDQAAALRFIAQASRPGGVLAPPVLSLSVPAFTGHHAFAGHIMWQPPTDATQAALFYSPDESAVSRRAILSRSDAVYVVADCGAPASLASDIAPLARPAARFGCVTVYRTR